MNTKYFIISCTLLMQAFLSPTELVASLVPLATAITNPTCVAFLQGNKIVIADKNHLEVQDATNNNILLNQMCDSSTDCDLVVN